MSGLRSGVVGSAGLLLMLAAGCASGGKPIAAVEHVDLARYMGDWYVIASIPSRIERNVYNAIESYTLLPDGRIQTVFRYRNGSFDAKLKTMRPVGTVNPNTGNAVWGMQFIWPIKAEYVIGTLSPDYLQTVVVRSARDYAWIMARTPVIAQADYERHVGYLRQLGYDVSKLRRVPQQGPEPVR